MGKARPVRKTTRPKAPAASKLAVERVGAPSRAAKARTGKAADPVAARHNGSPGKVGPTTKTAEVRRKENVLAVAPVVAVGRPSAKMAPPPVALPETPPPLPAPIASFTF